VRVILARKLGEIGLSTRNHTPALVFWCFFATRVGLMVFSRVATLLSSTRFRVPVRGSFGLSRIHVTCSVRHYSNKTVRRAGGRSLWSWRPLRSDVATLCSTVSSPGTIVHVLSRRCLSIGLRRAWSGSATPDGGLAAKNLLARALAMFFRCFPGRSPFRYSECLEVFTVQLVGGKTSAVRTGRPRERYCVTPRFSGLVSLCTDLGG